MTHVGRTLVTIAVTLLMLLTPLSFFATTADGDGEANTEFLIDYGNGRTKWIGAATGATISDALTASLTASGVPFNAGFTVVDGIAERTTGGTASGGSIINTGRTGNTVTSTWHVFSWNGSEWVTVPDVSAAYSGSELALAYYPDGILPASTPNHKTVWTAIQGDSWNSANITTSTEDAKGGKIWEYKPKYEGDLPSSLYGGILSAGGYVFLKYGTYSTKTLKSAVECRDMYTGDLVWTFEYSPNQTDTTSAAIAGQYLFVGGNNGFIYRINWQEGPGVDNSNVITFNGNAWDDDSVTIPGSIDGKEGKEGTWTASHSVNTESIVADAGAIYVKANNGMIYCFDLGLNLLWSYWMDGPNYYSTPTVFDGYVYAGNYDGCLYIFDQNSGDLITKQIVYRGTTFKGVTGAVATPIVYKDGDSDYTVFTTCSDGTGMDAKYSSLVIYKFNGSDLSLVKDFKLTFGMTGTYITRYETDTYKGVIVPFSKGIYAIDEMGDYKTINETLSGTFSPRNAPILVNNELLYMTAYSTRHVFELNLNDNKLYWIEFASSNYAMVSCIPIDGMIFVPDDSGIRVYHNGSLTEYVPPEPVKKESGLWKTLLIIAIVIVALLIITWLVLRFMVGFKHPYADVKAKVMRYFFGEDYSHNTKSKRKVRAVLIMGILVTLIVAMVSLCVGSETTMSPGEALSATLSAIKKGGYNLSYEEMLIYNQRLPRVMAAIAVGIGLSVAGAMYQAVIKNPLVEPYIMGVSSGAGTFAVAVMALDFTFFGLFAPQSPYLTAFSAIVGGLLAFGLTMILALKTGGKSINYVLAGIVIGLVFSAIQSVMMISAGTKLASALSWLYGSFSTMGWDKLWLVVIPVIALSFVPLIWAKEFNLVLLGEDQAQQMGLNAKRFDSLMLISASVLTAFCVAFCGIIGFVGLVIPHLSRMILGGDHRLMLPASMTLGGFLMVTADLLARMLLHGYELPVGAITTIIGVPMFAYLLIKRGRGYDE